MPTVVIDVFTIVVIVVFTVVVIVVLIVVAILLCTVVVILTVIINYIALFPQWAGAGCFLLLPFFPTCVAELIAAPVTRNNRESEIQPRL